MSNDSNQSGPRRFSRGRWQVERERFHISSPIPTPRSREARNMDESISSVARSLGLGGSVFARELCDHWKEIVGPLVASHTRPARYEYRKLTIYVSNNMWLTELSRCHKSAILKNLQQKYGVEKIKDIFLRIDPDSRG